MQNEYNQYLCLCEDKNVCVFGLNIVFKALMERSFGEHAKSRKTKTFFWLAARPQTFQVAIRTTSGARGGKLIWTGRTLFVGWGFSTCWNLSLFGLFILESFPSWDTSSWVPVCRRLNTLSFSGDMRTKGACPVWTRCYQSHTYIWHVMWQQTFTSRTKVVLKKHSKQLFNVKLSHIAIRKHTLLKSSGRTFISRSSAK